MQPQPSIDQSQFRIRLETEAKLLVQRKIREGELEFAWSYVLDYENQANPFGERREAVQMWKTYAAIDTDETREIIVRAETLKDRELKSKDALHIACAVEMQCDYFLTTDDKILNKMKDSSEIRVVDPIAFVREVNL